MTSLCVDFEFFLYQNLSYNSIVSIFKVSMYAEGDGWKMTSNHATWESQRKQVSLEQVEGEMDVWHDWASSIGQLVVVGGGS